MDTEQSTAQQSEYLVCIREYDDQGEPWHRDCQRLTATTHEDAIVAYAEAHLGYAPDTSTAYGKGQRILDDKTAGFAFCARRTDSL